MPVVPRRSVLVVEDSAHLAAFLVELVAGLTGIDFPQHAASLAGARRIFASEAPGLVILDIGLPDGSGLDLLAEIKALEPDTVVIVLSADATAENRAFARVAGAAAFLDKGHDLPTLARLLHRLLPPLETA